MLAVCAAIQWEIRPILQALQTVRRERVDSVRVWRSLHPRQPVLVFRTGMGWERAAASTREVLNEFPVRAILNTGCAGGLTADLSVAAVVVSTVVIAAADPASVHSTDGVWSDRLYAAAENAGLTASRGATVTSRAVLNTSAAKQSAANAFGALAVDMEGAAIAEVAALRGVPFASARAILDPLSVNIPLPVAQGKSCAPASRPVSYLLNFAQFIPLARAGFSVHVALSRLFQVLFEDCFPDTGKV